MAEEGDAEPAAGQLTEGDFSDLAGFQLVLPTLDRERGGVELCHVPPGNPWAAHTIAVGEPAVATHLGHGDHRRRLRRRRDQERWLRLPRAARRPAGGARYLDGGPGAAYVNVHTDDFPNGEIRGQIGEGKLGGRDRKGFDD